MGWYELGEVFEDGLLDCCFFCAFAISVFGVSFPDMLELGTSSIAALSQSCKRLLSASTVFSVIAYSNVRKNVARAVDIPNIELCVIVVPIGHA